MAQRSARMMTRNSTTQMAIPDSAELVHGSIESSRRELLLNIIAVSAGHPIVRSDSSTIARRPQRVVQNGPKGVAEGEVVWDTMVMRDSMVRL